MSDDFAVQFSIKGHDEFGREVMLNVRGATPDEFAKNYAAEGWIVNALHPLNWWPEDKSDVPAPTNVGDSTPAASPVGTTPAAPQIDQGKPGGESKPAETKTYNAGGVITTTSVKITADKNGLPVAEFWKDGREFPELKYNLGKTLEDRKKAIVKLLSGTGAWKEEMIVPGRTYSPAVYDVEWHPSDSKNSKGVPYKNVVSVTKSIHATGNG